MAKEAAPKRVRPAKKPAPPVAPAAAGSAGADVESGASAPAAKVATLSGPPRAAVLSRGGLWRMRKLILGLLLLAVGVAWPYLLSPNIPFLNDIQESTTLAFFSIVVIGLNLVTGYTGQVSIGHAGLVAVGAYTSAILVTRGFDVHLGPLAFTIGFWPIPVAILAALVASGIAGVLFGYPALRIRGPYLALATLAAGLIIYQGLLKFTDLTRGEQGIKDIPGFSLDLSGLGLSSFRFDENANFYFAFACLVVVYFVVRNLALQRTGRALIGLRESEIAAESLGVNIERYKLLSFTVSSMITGLAGCIFSFFYINSLQPSSFYFDHSIEFLVILVIGGVGTLGGPIVGAILISLTFKAVDAIGDATSVDLSRTHPLIEFGLLLTSIILVPVGTVGNLRRNPKLARLWLNPPTEGVPLREGNPVRIRRQEELDAAAGKPVLEATEVGKYFGGVRALDGVDLTIEPGTVHALIGPNGSGKSTFVNTVTQFYPADAGQIFFLGTSLLGVPRNQVATAGIARTFQNNILFPRLSALENVMVGMHVAWDEGAVAGALRNILLTPRSRSHEREMKARALHLLDYVGMVDLAEEEARNLSYGHQKMLEIARALAVEPTLLMLDEPAAGLSQADIDNLTGIIGQIRGSGVSILLIEHHMEFVMEISDVITVLDYGKRIAVGPPATVRADKRVIEAYLGEEVA